MNALNKKNGYTLTCTMLIIAVLAISLGSLVKFGGQGALSAQNMISRTKALAYAEAGIELAFSVVKTDFKNKNDLSNFIISGGSIQNGAVVNPYGDGKFTLEIISVGTNNQYCILRSTGECNGQKFAAEVVSEDKNAGAPDQEVIIETDPADIKLPDYSVVAGTTLTSNGDVTISTSDGSEAKVQANGDMDLTNSQANNAANNMTCSGNFTKKIPANGASGVDEVPIPVIPLDTYEAIATVIELGDAIPNSVPGGILYIQLPEGQISGTFSIGNNEVIPYTIITDIGIDIVNDGTTSPGINPENGKPYALGLIPKGGNVKVKGNSSTTGVVYIPSGDFNLQGTPTLEGQILATGATDFGGTPDAFLFTSPVLNPPTYTIVNVEAEQDVWIGAWQK